MEIAEAFMIAKKDMDKCINNAVSGEEKGLLEMNIQIIHSH